MQAIYIFEANGFPYEGTIDFGSYEGKWNHFAHKSFSVIYNSKDPTENEILVFPSEFSKFNLAYPDSLNWVRKLVGE